MKQYTEIEEVATGFAFLEGPRWHAGEIYVSDFHGQVVMRFTEAGKMTVVCEVPGCPSGLGFAPDGSLLIVSMTDRRLLRFDGRAVSEVADLSRLTPYNLNDMVVDRQGYAYVSHFGMHKEEAALRPTCMFAVSPDGRVCKAADDLLMPNGLVLTCNETVILVAEMFAARITAFDRLPDGSLCHRRIWANFERKECTTQFERWSSGEVLPDGLAIDQDENVWIADAGGTGPMRMTPNAAITAQVLVPGSHVYAVALGGENQDWLYMCAAPKTGSFDMEHERKARLLRCHIDQRM